MTDQHNRNSPTCSHRELPVPDIYMPAMPPLRQTEAVSRWVGGLRRRRALRQLLRMDERLLQDVGLSRERVRQAMHQRPGPASAVMKGSDTCRDSGSI
jgi:uncharacterized protein YjiS (DUF1127 family)